jgi:hypothetical protein
MQTPKHFKSMIGDSDGMQWREAEPGEVAQPETKNAEKFAVGQVDAMCIESLSPLTYKMWEVVMHELKITRKINN